MKKITYAIFALIIAGTSLTSCDNEPIDSAIDSSNPGNPSNPGGGSASGDYWPTAINNQWTYSQNGTAQPPMKIIGTDTFNNKTYFKFAPLSGTGTGSTASATTWLNKNNGVYTLKTGDLDIGVPGMSGTMTGFEYVILKDNIAVNETWNGSYSQTTTYTGLPAMAQTTNYIGKILEKDATVTVDGETYTNVIKVHMNQQTSLMGTSFAVINTEYWYAKDVGVVKTKTFTGTGSYESILTDYILH